MIPERLRKAQGHSFTQEETPEGVVLRTAAFPSKSWTGADLYEAMDKARKDVGNVAVPMPRPAWESEWETAPTDEA